MEERTQTIGPGGEFNGNPKLLAFFLTQVWTYMQEYEADLKTNPAKVRIVTMALEAKQQNGW